MMTCLCHQGSGFFHTRQTHPAGNVTVWGFLFLRSSSLLVCNLPFATAARHVCCGAGVAAANTYLAYMVFLALN
jgi:hypothetical protein